MGDGSIRLVSLTRICFECEFAILHTARLLCCLADCWVGFMSAVTANCPTQIAKCTGQRHLRGGHPGTNLNLFVEF